MVAPIGATEDAAARRVIAGQKPASIAGRGTSRSNVANPLPSGNRQRGPSGEDAQRPRDETARWSCALFIRDRPRIPIRRASS